MYVIQPDGIKSWPLGGLYPVPNTFYPQHRSLDLLGKNNVQAYEKLYRSQPWVAAVTNKLARGIARLPWGAFTEDDQGHTARVPRASARAISLLNRPYPGGGAFQLKEATTGSICIHGNSLIVKDRGDGANTYGLPPVALWPVPWRYVEVIAGENQPVAAYVLQVGGVRRIILPEDVVHHQWWSPLGGLGISPLEQLRTGLTLEDAAQRYSIASFANGARPAGALSTDKPMNKPARDELRAEIEARHAGVDNAFRVALLTNGLTWVPFGDSASDAELINQRKFTLMEVTSVYDVNADMIQAGQHGAPRAGIDEIHRMMYQDTYGPWLAMEEEGFQIQLIENEPLFRGIDLHYDLEETLRGDPVLRSQMTQRFFQSARNTPNELREMDGLPDFPGSTMPDGTRDPDHPANQLYVPVNMLPIDHVLDSIDLQPDEAEPGAGGEPQRDGEANPLPSQATRSRVHVRHVRQALRLLSAHGFDMRSADGVDELLTEAEWNERQASKNGHVEDLDALPVA